MTTYKQSMWRDSNENKAREDERGRSESKVISFSILSEKEIERKRGDLPFGGHSPNTRPSQEPGMPTGSWVAGTHSLGHHLLPPRVSTSRKLDQTRRSRDLSQVREGTMRAAGGSGVQGPR